MERHGDMDGKRGREWRRGRGTERERGEEGERERSGDYLSRYMLYEIFDGWGPNT